MKKLLTTLIFISALSIGTGSKAEINESGCTCDPPSNNPFLECEFGAQRAKDQTEEQTGDSDVAEVVYQVYYATCLNP